MLEICFVPPPDCRVYPGYKVVSFPMPERACRGAELVGTAGRHDEVALGCNIGVSGPRNRGGGKTLVRADRDEIVVSITFGSAERVATMAYLSPEKAREIALRLLRAADDAEGIA